jgi:hypothetical protein
MKVFDRFDPVGGGNQARVDARQGVGTEMKPQRPASRIDAPCAGMLAEHEPGARRANNLRSHDFVGQRIFQDAVLMDAGLMRERVRADDCFVGRDRHAHDLAEQPAGRAQLLRPDSRPQRQLITAHVQGHDDLFERCVAGAFADPVDGAFHLACPSLQRGQ